MSDTAFSNSCFNTPVLMVDDEPFMMRAVQRVLMSAGFQVHTCDNWAEISRMVRTHQPRVILLDYNMPMLRGDDICAILRRNDVCPSSKLVFFSSEDEQLLREAVSKSHADGYIQKQIPHDQLIDRVRSYAGC